MAQNKPKTTIVRAADGTLWAVSKDGTVKPLDDKDAKKVEEIVAPGGATEQNIGSNRQKRDVASRGRLHPKGPYRNTRRGRMIE